MALAIAFEDAKKNQSRSEGDSSRGTVGGALSTRFFSSPDDPNFPHAGLSQRDAGRVSRAHYHPHDQFQVVVEGKGKLGRHELVPYSVHFSRAYTPYGPLVSDMEHPLTFFAMRTHYAPSQRLPQNLAKLKQVPDRRPWQVTLPVTIPALSAGNASSGVLLQTVPGISDENGLAVYTLTMKPHATTAAPDPSRSDGQYLVVLKGSVIHQNKEYKALALVFLYPDEGPLTVRAGAEGMEALVLNYPQVNGLRAAPKKAAPATGLKRWQCALCAFSYDEAIGMPEEGIPAGTRWEDVPETWHCPDCSASKADFQMVELT